MCPSVSWLYYGHQHQLSQMNRDTFQWCVRELCSVSERIIQLHTEIGRNTIYRHSSTFRSSQCYTHEAHIRVHVGNYVSYLFAKGHAVAPLVEALRYKPGSIPDGATGIFHWHNPYGHINGPGVESASNRMSTRNISWGVKAAGG